jgi:hypothetical protein
MNKIRLVPVLAFALLVVLVSSCSKDNEAPFGGTGNTDLQVYVLNSNQQLMEDATVTLFKTKSNRDAGIGAINAGVTGPSGFVYFSELEPSVYYIAARKDGASAKTGKGDTGVPIGESQQSAVTIVLQ